MRYAPDETRHSFQRSDYFAGHAAGSEDRTAMLAPERFLETAGMSEATDAEIAEMRRLGMI